MEPDLKRRLWLLAAAYAALVFAVALSVAFVGEKPRPDFDHPCEQAPCRCAYCGEHPKPPELR